MKLTKIAQIAKGQDGAFWGRYLFRFDTKGNCRVYDSRTWAQISAFALDQLDRWAPHSNAVCFGREYYAPEDEFPLLYTNVYNTYAKDEDPRKGVCCVYRLQRKELHFVTTLVQTIRIGFVEDELWKSGEDVRPYGNFVIDRQSGTYWAFTMRDTDRVTRYFAFALPTLSQGADVTLTAADIQKKFDCPYHHYIQGACFHEGKIYSCEGFTDSEKNPPAIRIIDTVRGEQETMLDLVAMGYTVEPELIDVQENQVYYSDAEGALYRLL